jgi:Tol biopolymer transport system component
VIDQESVERAAERFKAPDGALERLIRRRDRKRRNQRIAAGVVGIAFFVAAVWIVTSVGSFNNTPQPAVQPTPTPPPGTAPGTYLLDLNTGEMTPLPKSITGWGHVVSLDSNMVAYFSPDGAGRDQLFIASLDGTDVQQVTHGRRGAAAVDTMGALDLSPDGAAIVYGARTSEEVNNVFVLDLATGETSQFTNEKRTHPCGGFCDTVGAFAPRFSPDGASILYDLTRGVEGDVGVWITPVTGGKSVLLAGGGKNDAQAVTGALSPDGSTLAVACFGRLEGICIANADGTDLRVLVSNPSPDSGPSLVVPNWSPDGTRIAYTGQANGDRVFVVDVATGETTFVADGFASDWLDDHTLIIERFAR